MDPRRRQRSPSPTAAPSAQRQRSNEQEPPFAYTIKQRIDEARVAEYSYEQLAAAPFLPEGFIPESINTVLRELTHGRVVTYRSIIDAIDPLKRDIIAHAILILRLRAAFRRLAHRFIRRQCEKIAFQEVDPITLTAVQQPVIVYDMKNRCRHRFEARALMSHIHSQLLHTSYGFAAPQEPRNPLTNLSLGLGQLASIYTQLTSYGLCRWTFTGLRAYFFSMERFTKMFETPLRHAAVRSTVLHDLSNEMAAEQLNSFIVVWAASHACTFSAVEALTLEYATTQRPADSFLMCWRRLYMVAVWHGISMNPLPNRNDDLEVHVQRRAVHILTRILTMNVKNYLREIRPDYEQWLATREADDDEDDDEDEDDIFDYIHAVVQASMLPPG